MPELPEVETTRIGIAPYIVDQIIDNIIIRSPKLRWPIPSSIQKNLPGQIVRSVERRAKYLLMRFDSGTLILHLGMSGRLQALSKHTEAQKHDHVDIGFKNGAYLRYTDPRRFGSILWTDKSPLEHKLLKDLGPEPFDKTFNANYLLAQAKNKKQPIKAFIMDSKIVVGVGNIYASEALFASKIHPLTATKTINIEQHELLVKNIRAILKQAIKNGGTTLKDFLDVSGKPGYFSQKLQVYGRVKESCFECSSAIESVVIGQRNTFFCPQCQQLLGC